MSAGASQAAAAPRTVEVFGAKCFRGTLDEAARLVIERAHSGLGGYVVQCNVHVLMTAQKDPILMRALAEAWLVMPDGAPVAWMARRLGAPGAERVGGPDLMSRVLELGREAGLRHVLVGSSCGTLARLEERLSTRLPDLDIVGTLAPPFRDPSEWSDEAVRRVLSWQPDIVWLALGAPRQELWMAQWARILAPAITLGVGAAFDFHAGTKSRAPRWMQRAGLEWAHRLGSEPIRLSWRYGTTNSAFACRAAATLGRRHRSWHA